MTYSKSTLTDCLQSLADRHDNGKLPTSSAILSTYTRWLNKGVCYCSDKMRINKQTSLTTSGGTIALPDDFILINNIFDSGKNEQVMVDPTDLASQTGNTYWISGDQIGGFYLNTPTDGTFTVNYAYRPAPMVNGTDVCVIPDIEAPVAYAYSFIRKGESDPFEDSAAALQECDARLAEMQSAYGINADSIGLTWEG